MAELGSIVRFYPNYFDAFSLSLVLDKALKLIETPITNPIVHSLSSSLFSYPFEVFHNDFVPIKVGNDVFADVVVSPSHKPFFSSRKLLEKPLAGTSAFSLESATQILELPLNLLDFGRTIKPVVACDCEIVHSEVNAENNIMRSVVNDINLSGEREQEESSTFPIHSQEALIDFPTEILPITTWDVQFETLPPLKQSKRKNIPFEFGTSRKIISNRSMIDKGFGFSLFDYPTGLFDTSDSKLCWQSSSQILVNKRMKPDIISYSFLPSYVNTELHPFSISLDGSDCLFGCADFDFSCCDTTHTNHREEQVFKTIGGEVTGFLPTLKSWVSTLTIL